MRYLMSLLAVAVLSAPALAQDPGAFGPRQGDWEFTISGSGSNDRDFDSGAFSVTGDLSHYLTRELSVGLRQDFGWAGGSGDIDDSWTAASRATVAYHFDLGQWRPFIGGNIGYKYGRFTKDTGTAGPEAGLKWYVKEETFVFGRVGYDVEFDEFNELDDNRGTWVYALGVGFNF
ncbi:MAG: hypothetical protein WD534_06505 [Phycisphaeraceae bacterium]